VIKSFNYESIDLVLFDFDGVLVNSEPFYNNTWARLLEPLGKTFEDSLLTGKTNHQFLSQFNFDSATIEDLLERKFVHEKDFFEHEKMDSRILYFLQSISKSYEMGIVSNNTSSNILSYLEKNECLDLFKNIVTPDSKLAPKPSPDLYLYALKKFDKLVGRTLVIEDSQIGMESAKAAGIHCYLINYQNLEEDLFSLYTYLTNS
jgi:HAD superfamily hydrolase (TIGR01509 family)